MGTVSRVHTFSSGAILTAAQLNNEFDNLLTSSAINGGLDATNLGVTAGQATASKALVVDSSRNLADGTAGNRINNLALSGTLESTGLITATAGITSGSNIVSDTDSTDDLGTTGVRWRNLYVDDVTVTNNVSIGGTLTLTGGLTLNGNVAIGDSASDTLTVNSTITSNLIFTDNTYDIGASGATRPRDLHLSRNALMGGTLGVTGVLTATAGVTSGSNIVSDTDSTDDLGTTSVRWANLYVDSIGDSGQALAITAGSNNVNITAGTLALTGAQTISSTLGVSGLITASGGVSGTTGTFSGDLTVDTSTLKVDSSNNRVGVLCTNPNYPFTVQTASNHRFFIRDSSTSAGSEIQLQAGNDADNATTNLKFSASRYFLENGNVGIGLTPSAWRTTETALQITSRAALYADSNLTTALANNLFINNSGYALIEADAASQYYQYQGAHYWQTVASGSAGANVSPSTVMVILSGGDVGLGTQSPEIRLSVTDTYNGSALTSNDIPAVQIINEQGSYTADNVLGVLGFGKAQGFASGVRAGMVAHYSGTGSQSSNVGAYLSFRTSADAAGDSSERLRITSDGDLLIGETSNQIARVYSKTSTVGDYAYMGETTGADRGPLSFSNTSASLNDIMLVLTATRTATTAFDFARLNSNNGADIEFLFEGNGDAYADGSWNGSGADYQEYFESTTGDAAEVGRAIVLDGDRVRYYNADTDSTDDIMGVTRPQADNKNSAVVGNVAWNHWTDKYLTDDWGVYLREDVTVWTHINEKGEDFAVYERDELAKDPNWTPPEGATSSTESVRKLNPDYDESLKEGYQSRKDRDEWWLIGLLGQIQVKAGEPVNPRWIKMKNISDAVELYYVR